MPNSYRFARIKPFRLKHLSLVAARGWLFGTRTYTCSVKVLNINDQQLDRNYERFSRRGLIELLMTKSRQGVHLRRTPSRKIGGYKRHEDE